MTAITPGDEVTVTITGTLQRRHGISGLVFGRVRTSLGQTIIWTAGDPDVKVTALRPDRPTRREVLEQHSLNWNADCECGWPELGEPHDYPAHLDAVLTKWEEN